MSKNFHISDHSLKQLKDRGIIPPCYSCKKTRYLIYNQCLIAKKYISLRNIIYKYENIEYVFDPIENILITSIVH